MSAFLCYFFFFLEKGAKNLSSLLKSPFEMEVEWDTRGQGRRWNQTETRIFRLCIVNFRAQLCKVNTWVPAFAAPGEVGREREAFYIFSPSSSLCPSPLADAKGLLSSIHLQEDQANVNQGHS